MSLETSTAQASVAKSAAPAATPLIRHESCSLSSVRRVAAMLDLSPDAWAVGQHLPRGWHFILLAADTAKSALRADGFPGLGVPMPDLGLPRLMLGGRKVTFQHDIPIGAELTRSSATVSVAHKKNTAGPVAVVTLSHALHLRNETEAAVLETQTYLLLPPRVGALTTPEANQGAAIQATHLKTVTPDDTLLFHYSALGFNSHRIHLDREHARQVEGFPDLVVNGGLATLLMTEFLRQDLGVTPRSLAVRHLAPLYCQRPMTLSADPVEGGWTLKAFDDHHQLAVEMEVKTA